jgi:hypothetical protein
MKHLLLIYRPAFSFNSGLFPCERRSGIDQNWDSSHTYPKQRIKVAIERTTTTGNFFLVLKVKKDKAVLVLIKFRHYVMKTYGGVDV